MKAKKSALFRLKMAFTLVELLVVISIIALLTGLSGPAIRTLSGAGTVNKAIFDFSGTLQVARAYAMANHTYVRVAIAETNASNTVRLVILSLYSADGTLSAGSATPAASDMANPTMWPALGKALSLDNLSIYDVINGASPDTSNDIPPSQTLSSITFSRRVAADTPTFKGIIQYSPSGEAAVLQSLSAASIPNRYIKIAMDQPAPGNASLPISGQGQKLPQQQFILRVSGVNGSVAILRKGEGI